MPERAPTQFPTNICGTTLFSGDPNTGQQLVTYGGSRTFNKQSGTAGGTAQIWTGAGRLDSVHLHPGATTTIPIASGISQQFWDQSAVVSGMSASGLLLASLLPAMFQGINSITTNSGQLFYGGFQTVGYSFKSGLAFNSTSGQVGFTASFTPVVSG